MTTFAHDKPGSPTRSSGLPAGLAFAVVSAVTFGLSGTIARGLFDAGWSTGGALLARVGIGVMALTPFALVALRGRWIHVRRRVGTVLAYGILGAAGAQFCYFSAVQLMDVGPALLIEYTAPVAVVAWMWLRHGQRPGPLTLLGAALAVLGLVFVLDLVTGADLSLAGVAWALAAMVGAAAYFVVIGDDSTGIPPLALAWLGLVVGFVVLGGLALVRLIPVEVASGPVEYAGAELPWWLPILGLGVLTCAVAYGTGVMAGRRLGSRLASFVALLEVLTAVVAAWVLVGQEPGVAQVVGGALVLAGVVAVKLGERDTAAAAEPVVDPLPAGRVGR